AQPCPSSKNAHAADRYTGTKPFQIPGFCSRAPSSRAPDTRESPPALPRCESTAQTDGSASALRSYQVRIQQDVGSIRLHTTADFMEAQRVRDLKGRRVVDIYVHMHPTNSYGLRVLESQPHASFAVAFPFVGGI